MQISHNFLYSEPQSAVPYEVTYKSNREFALRQICIGLFADLATLLHLMRPTLWTDFRNNFQLIRHWFRYWQSTAIFHWPKKNRNAHMTLCNLKRNPLTKVALPLSSTCTCVCVCVFVRQYNIISVPYIINKRNAKKTVWKKREEQREKKMKKKQILTAICVCLTRKVRKKTPPSRRVKWACGRGLGVCVCLLSVGSEQARRGRRKSVYN